MRKQLDCLAVVGLVIGVAPARADVIPIAPFQGTWSETWESFTTTLGGPETDYLPDPSTIMDGGAMISNPHMDVYQTVGSPYHPPLGSSGRAQAADGIKGMNTTGFMALVAIEFSTPVSSFGAYWAAATDTGLAGDPATFGVSFFDAFGAPIGSTTFTYSRSQQQDGLLEWHGWDSTIPIRRLTYVEDYTVIDGLQANPIPEPATLWFLMLSISTLWRRRGKINSFSRDSNRLAVSEGNARKTRAGDVS